jgi:hypothetical protein
MLHLIVQVLFILLAGPLNLRTSANTERADSGDIFKLKKPRAGNRRKSNSYWKCFHKILYGKSGFKLSLLGQFLFLASLLWLSLKSKTNWSVRENTSNFKTCFNDIVINCELTNLPDKLSCIWTATRDVQLRKWSYPPNYRYGLHFQPNGKPSHVVLLLLLAGDIATNPGPCSSTPRINNNKNALRCLYLNARSLVRKLDELQVLANDDDLLAITETWLRPDIKDCELLPKLNFTIFRKDRLSRAGGGVMLAV